MADTVQVPRQWLCKVFDTLLDIEKLADGERLANPQAYTAQLRLDVEWLVTAADVMLTENEVSNAK